MKITATPEPVPTRVKTHAMEKGVMYRVDSNYIAVRVQPIKASEFSDYRTYIVFDTTIGDTIVKIGTDFDRMCPGDYVTAITDSTFTLTLSNG